MKDQPTLLVTGAAGNLGGLFARHLVGSGLPLRLMVHRTPLPADLAQAGSVTTVRADLSRRPRRSLQGLEVPAAAPAAALARLHGRRALRALRLSLPHHTATRDFITIGRVPYCGNTDRMRAELVAGLVHPTLESGLRTLR